MPYNSYDVCAKNLELDKLILPLLTFFFLHITQQLGIVLIFLGEILSWSLMEVTSK